MTKEDMAPIFLAGFLTGGIIIAAGGISQINQLRHQLTMHQQNAQTVMAEVHGLSAQLAILNTRITNLAQKWENDLQPASRHYPTDTE